MIWLIMFLSVGVGAFVSFLVCFNFLGDKLDDARKLLKAAQCDIDIAVDKLETGKADLAGLKLAGQEMATSHAGGIAKLETRCSELKDQLEASQFVGKNHPNANDFYVVKWQSQTKQWMFNVKAKNNEIVVPAGERYHNQADLDKIVGKLFPGMEVKLKR